MGTVTLICQQQDQTWNPSRAFPINPMRLVINPFGHHQESPSPSSFTSPMTIIAKLAEALIAIVVIIFNVITFESAGGMRNYSRR
jgi:hypothetical protein